MPINAQRPSSNTNKPQSRQNIFSSQSHVISEQALPTSSLVNASPRVTNSHPAGAPNPLPLNVEGAFDISRDIARLLAAPTEKRTNAAPTQTHASEQGRGHLLHNGEGVPPAGQSENFIRPFGMTAPRPRAQADPQSEGEPKKRGVPIDPDKFHTASAELQRPPRGVRQDKYAQERVRRASLQAVTAKQDARTRRSDTKSARSQKHSKRQTVQVAAWIKPALRAELETIARKNGLTLSRTIAALLEEAILQQLHVQHAVLLQPIVEQAIARQMRSYSGRIAILLVRSLFASEQTRSLVTNILGRQQGITQPVLREILNSSGRSAKRNITNITPQLAALVQDIQAWMEKEEGEDKHV